MSSFLAPASGKTAKGSAVQTAEKEENVQTKSFSDPKVSDNSTPTSLQKMHSAVQAKLNIGSPGDKFEKEADETADKVMKMPEADVQKTHAGGDDQPIQKKSSRSNDEPDIAKKEDETVSKKDDETVRPKVEENTISKKSFLQTELFDDSKDVRNDFINAKEDETVSKKEDETVSKKEDESVSMKEDASSVAQAKEETPDVSMNEKEGYAQKKEDSPSVSMKEDESISKKEDDTISKKSFLQTALFNEDKDTRNDMLNAKFDFPKVPELAEPKKLAKAGNAVKGATGAEKPAAAKGASAMAGKKAGADPIKEAADIKPLKKRKAPKIKKPKIQKKEDEVISKKSFLQTVAKDENAQAKEEEVQKKNASDAKASANFESSLKSTKGGGSAMSESTQADMGGRFGRDFSNVKIHDNSAAAGLNQEIGAKAFTNENNIYFNSGQYNENSADGKKLLAHELTHTIHQGASGDTVQTFTPEPKTATKEPMPAPINDGEEVKSASTEYYENDEDQDEDAPTSVAEMDEEDKEDAANRDGAEEEKQEVDSSGVSKPTQDRGKAAAEKTLKNKEDIVAAADKKAEVAEPEKDKGKDAPKEKVSPTDAALGMAAAAEQTANAVKEPLRLKKFEHPRIETPKDAEGEDLPKNPETDTTVSGLANMAEIFRDKGLELQTYAAAEEKKSYAADAYVWKHKAQLATNEDVTTTGKEQADQRKEINDKSKPALKESDDRQKFVETEAPGLNAEAKSGQEDSGELVDETKTQAEDNKSNISDDPDAKADSEAQGEDMESSAEGSATIFDAIIQTIKATAQYAMDAEVAKEDNATSENSIAENEEQIAMAQTRIGELDAGNATSKEQIAAVEFKPEEMRTRSASLNDNGEEIIRASMYMEDELKDIQEQYYANMAKVPGREAAAEEKKKKEEEQEQVNADQAEVLMLAGMGEEEQQEYVDTLPVAKKDTLIAALESMVSFVEDKGTDDSEGKRMKLDTGLNQMLDSGEEDPRAFFTAEHETERKNRLQAPLDVADRNMGLISESDKAALAMKLAGEQYTDEMSNMVTWDAGKDMVMGMIDPRMSLQGVVGGFEKFGSGVLNIFNWEAWEKDPLGNLLQIGVDLSTGIAQMAGGILGLGALIQTVMIAINIITWGFGIPFTMPEMLWMGTVMSVSGWVALIAGTLSALFSSLAYTKNLHDAATAPSAREFLGNVQQMKENTTDGTTGLMSILGGKGGIKMGKGFNMQNIVSAMKPSNLLKSLKGGLKGAGNKIKGMAQSIGRGMTKLFQGGMKAFKSFGAKIKKLFSKKNKKLTPDEISKKTVAEHQTPDGHTQKVLDDGQVATCSSCSTTRNKYQAELEANPKLNEKLNKIEEKLNADPTNKKLIEQHKKLESQLDNFKNRKPSLDGDPPGSFRDKNGKLHGEDGEFIKDPNTPEKPEKVPGDKNNKSGSTEANRYGIQKHKEYRAGQADKVNTFKEYTLPNGKRIDFLDAKKGIVYELKPNNLKATNLGKQQLIEYIAELKKIPKYKNIDWKGVIETYDSPF